VELGYGGLSVARVERRWACQGGHAEGRAKGHRPKYREAALDRRILRLCSPWPAGAGGSCP
jgi:hypothetical protein